MTRILPTLLCVALALAGVALSAAVTIADDEPDRESDTDLLLDLSPYAGKVIYLDFWASWCAPCQKSFPWMIELDERLSEQGLAIVTVNVDRTRKAADRFLSRMGSELPVIYDPEGKIAADYELDAMPSSYIYSRDGELRKTHLGFRPDDIDELEAELKALLAEEAPNAKVD